MRLLFFKNTIQADEARVISRIIIVALFEPNLCEHSFIKKPGNYFSLAISINFYFLRSALKKDVRNCFDCCEAVTY